MIRPSAILDSSGKPFKVNGHSRLDLADLQPAGQRKRAIEASYDAARDSDEFRNYWANADRYDADSANCRAVRETLVPRSRYEVGNNGYADGIAQTYATDVVGGGPKLRMQTASTGFNQLVEFEWGLWAKRCLVRRKLWCMAHAKHQDGETFGVARTNPRVQHAVKLDLVLYETEQCQSPYMDLMQPGRIDGIAFDEFGNPVFYDLLRQHPGSNGYSVVSRDAERIPARFMLHWFRLRRPNQHRGIPESASTLNVGAAARRWREATLAAAETAADFTLFLKTQFEPDSDDLDAVDPMSSLEIKKRMMTALPNSVEPFQLEAKHPNSTYESFHKQLVNEQARPKSMPFNKAACDSSSYNYASGRLDHQTYYGALDVDRADADDLVLDPLLDVWFDEAIRAFGWLGGNPAAVGPAARAHSWAWPKHRVADVEAEANSNDKRLRNGSLSLSTLYADNGEDFEDEIQKMAVDFGVTPEEMRRVLLATMFPAAANFLNQKQTQQSGDPNAQG